MAEKQPADRIKAVEKQLNKERSADQGKRLSAKDIDALRQWMSGFLIEQEAKYLRTLSDAARTYLEKMSPADRRHQVLLLMVQRRNVGGSGPPMALMTGEDLRQLRAALGPEARGQLESLPLARQRQQVAEWIRDILRQRRPRGHPPAVDDAKLAEFFESGLTDAQRDRLLAMPGDEMPQALQQMYLLRGGPHEKPASTSEGNAHGNAIPKENRPQKSRTPRHILRGIGSRHLQRSLALLP